MENNSIVLAETILQDATDYIGNDMEKFCADHYALETIRNNESFRQTVIDEVVSLPEEYAESCANQEEAAKFVWAMYKKWAYGNQ